MKSLLVHQAEAHSCEPRRMKFLLHDDLYRAIALRAQKQNVSHRCIIEEALSSSLEEELSQLKFSQPSTTSN